jgi:hypothetical protein
VKETLDVRSNWNRVKRFVDPRLRKKRKNNVSMPVVDPVEEFDSAVAHASEKRGLRLRSSERRDGVLILSAESLERLPSVEQLSELGSSLRGDGVRFVALRLDEGDE